MQESETLMSRPHALLPHCLLFAAALQLAACDSNKAPAAEEADPALAGALADQIMVDPDLAGQNRAGQALGVNGPASVALPPTDRSPEVIAAARAEALKIAGGSITAAPVPVSGPAAAGADVVTPAQMAEAAKGIGSGCADKVEYSAGWAARLPAGLTVYPRGHVIEAAGTDRDGCRLRVVNFVTPVSGKDVIDFYYTRVRAAGYDAEHRLEGNDSVLGGGKDTAAYVVYARKLGNGLTEVDIVANGG